MSSTGVSTCLAFIPLDAAWSVEILKIRWASSTCWGLTTLVKWILAIASDSLIIASSYLTVIGIPLVFLAIF